jgi:hypothetical protein
MDTKTEALILRIGAAEKQQIADAAHARGESITTLVTRAALKEAKKILTKTGGKKMEQVVGRHGGVPSFFRAGCWEASRGGTNTYADAAWHLASAVSNEIPYDIENDDWSTEVDKLLEACAQESEDDIWGWFSLHYPKCMKLIPVRRRDQFVKGVLKAYEDGRIEA